MGEKVIRDFPQEAPNGPWPLFIPSQQERQYQPVVESPAAFRRRQRREERDLLYLDVRSAVFKGVILGMFSFGVVFGIIWNLPFWLQSWHWALASGGIILLGLLAGLNITVVFFLIGTLVLSLLKVIADPSLLLTLLLFIAGGIVIRGIIEILPFRDF